MKTVKLFDGDKTITEQVRYSIFDTQKPIMDDEIVIEADCPINAVRSYFEQLGSSDVTIKRCGDNHARICVTQFYIFKGSKYKYRRRVWFSVS